MGSDNMASRQSARLQVLLRAAMMGAALVSVGAQASEMIGVNLDQAKLVKLPEGTSTVVVGNPAIADVTIQRNGVVVITGRRAGRTNFIALDKTGSIISESTVAVSVATAGRVLMRRGMDVVTYDCSTECLPAAGFGDEEKSFGRIMGQATTRTKEAREAMVPTIK
jgi:S-formylglutathione hydrolase FrmB